MRSSLFFFDVTATPDIYTLSLHDALPISRTLGEQGLHPYTLGLLRSFPPLTGPLERMQGIPGSPPDLASPPTGCRFHPRCPHCRPDDAALFRRQTTEKPVLREVAPGHRVACHLVEEG